MKANKLLVCALAILLALPMGALAEGAAKDEIVYAMLADDGSAGTVYVVNAFELASDGEIADYGDYTEARNLTTTEALTVSDGAVRASAKAGRFYYQGTLEGALLPWLVEIQYLLDGAQTSAEALSGASGALEIRVSIRKNPDAKPGFAESCALQTTLTLDAAKCRNVRAEGATMAVSGADRQVSFTLLPGGEADYAVFADVENFSMDGIRIAGARMSMDVNVDLSEYEGMFSELTDGVKQLSAGAASLSNGLSTVNDTLKLMSTGAQAAKSGLSELKDSAAALVSQNGALSAAAQSISDGLDGLQAAIDDLSLDGGAQAVADAAGAMQSGAAALSEKLAALEAAISDAQAGEADGKAAREMLAGAVESLEERIEQSEAGSDARAALETELANTKNLLSVIEKSDAVLAAKDALMAAGREASGALSGAAASVGEALGTWDEQKSGEALESGAGALSGAVRSLSESMDALSESLGAYTGGAAGISDSLATIAKGMGGVATGVTSMSGAAGKLESGAAQVSDGLSQLDTAVSAIKLSEIADEAAGSLTGGDGAVTSFASDKNGSVQSVQFVMMTKGVPEPAKEAPIENEKKDEGLIDRFLNLFR